MADAEKIILDMLRELFRSFQTLDPGAVVPYYQTPSMSIAPERVSVMATAADVQARFAPLMERLRESGYARSEVNEARVTSLGDKLALLDVKGARYKANGQLLESFAVTYTLRKISGEWKIVVIASYPPSNPSTGSG